MEEKEKNQGRKDDHSKRRVDLLPVKALESVADVLTFGAEKYGDDNWQKVPDAKRRYYAASLRHLFAWWRGQQVDKDSGYPHLAHAGCCVLFLLAFEMGLDKPEQIDPTGIHPADYLKSFRVPYSVDKDGEVRDVRENETYLCLEDMAKSYGWVG